MRAKKFFSVLLSVCFLLPALSLLSGCSSNAITLRVYNWEEYIDEGGEDSYAACEENPDPLPMVDEFEVWYKETYGTAVRVEYSTFGTNEDMYNQLKLGNSYDLVCPSEYLIMKLIAEDMIEPLSDGFFHGEHSYYVNKVSTYIADVFAEERDLDGQKYKLEDYAAGYMWGTTGLLYNPDKVTEAELEEQGWGILLNPAYKKKVTTKDNVRDSYFVGLAIAYERELYDLKAQYNADEIDEEEYNRLVTVIMNRTDEDSVTKVQDILFQMKENIFGFETDTGKADMVNGKIYINFAWSGDAVYAMDLAEDEDGVSLNFYIPQESANLFFDGWAIPKDENRPPEVKQAAEAFINFLSKPENAVRNMDYIGYTSVIAGDEILEYVEGKYGAKKGDKTAELYDLSYFFGEGASFMAPAEQFNRQLFAQYPRKEDTYRCAVMNYYEKDDARINELWTQVKGAQLDAWAIVVLCVAAVAIVLFIVISKFGNRIDLFRPKPKKGYERIKQERIQ